MNFVNVGRGNLTFVRRDLVTVGRMPVVVARVYDSAGRGSAEFGPGWHLSAAETIEVKDGVATLFSETGAEIRFGESGSEFVLSPDFPSDSVRLTKSESGTLVSRIRTGQMREYSLIGTVYRLTKVTDRNGNEVRLIYASGVLSRIENASHFAELGRDADGRVVEVRDDAGRRVQYGYDDKGLLTQVTDLGGNVWTYQYTGQDLLHRAVDPFGRENFKVWYTSDRRVQALDLPSGRIAYAYDDAARATTVVDRKSLTSRYFQNEEGVTTRIVNALGEETAISLDSAHNVSEVRQNGQVQHQLEYDGDHHLILRRSFTGGETTQYQYDATGNLSRITFGDGPQAAFEYDARGNLLSATDGEGQRTYEYSAAGDVTEFRQDESYLALGYTADGLVSAAEDEPGYRTTFRYSATGRPLEVNFGNGTTVAMEFDSLGLRRKQDYSHGGRVDYWYDPAGNLTEIKVLHADGSQTGQKLWLDGSYQIVKQTLSSGAEYTFQYDKNGNLTEARSATTATQFEYDALNRLTAVVTAEGRRLSYSYAPGERSLVARYDHGASLSAADRRDSGLTFASYWEVAATRGLASHFGAVRYSETLGRFQLSGTEGKEVVTAESGVLTPLEKLRLYDYGVPLDDRIGEFQKPSNLLFLPPEYASVNCCPLCIPGQECPECDPAGGGGGDASLACTQGVTRGDVGECVLTGAIGSIVRNWRFTGASGGSVSRGSSTSHTWSGIIVASGTVTVDVDGVPVSDGISVIARSWNTAPALPAGVPNGTIPPPKGTLPVPPQPGQDSGLGVFEDRTGDSGIASITTISGGPNHGYSYYATQPSITTFFRYTINPDLENSASTFSQRQCGNYNATTNPGGYISWSQLLAQTKRHEYNSTSQSHHAFYTTAMNSADKNPGKYVEARVAIPGTDLNQFNSVTRSGLNTRYAQIDQATQVEPFGVNSSATGTFLGNINYAPYAPCN